MTTNLDARLASYHSPVLSIFRIVFGLLYMLHGSMKLFGWPLGAKVPVGTWPFWWAGLVEFVLGLLIVVGLFTRIAAFIASGEMALAYFYQHWPPLKGGSPSSFWPFDAQQLGGNGGELAIMFCFAFLLLATTGAGAWSADTRRRVAVGRTGATAGGVVTGRAAPRARGGLMSRFRRR
jgi:putative oxidoreductase